MVPKMLGHVERGTFRRITLRGEPPMSKHPSQAAVPCRLGTAPTYRRILVALDGSALAECSLPHVAMLAQRLGAAVTLLRVVTPRGPLVAEVPDGALHLSAPAQAPRQTDTA